MRFFVGFALLAAACGGMLDPREPPPARPPRADDPLAPRAPVGIVARDYDDPATGRRLATTIWYPASSDTVEERIWWDGIFPGQGKWDAAWRPPRRRLPLVLLSHGSGGDGSNLAWLAEAFASHGFVAAAVDHPGDRFGDVTAVGRFAAWRRARDVRVVLDRLIADPELGPRIDRRRIAAAGHSAGGFTVLLVAGARFRPTALVDHCRGPEAGPDCKLLGDVDLRAFPDLAVARASHRDRRVRAVFAMSPVFGPGVTTPSLRAVAIPVLLAGSRTDELVPFDENGARYAALIPGARLETVPAAGHFVFMPVCSEAGRIVAQPVCVDPGMVDRGEVHAQVTQVAIAFFDRTLGVR